MSNFKNQISKILLTCLPAGKASFSKGGTDSTPFRKGGKGDLNSSSGFTLIELLVVIAIIGILTALSTVNYISIKARARDAQRKSDLHQIQAALELYRSDQGGYPAANAVMCGQPLASATATYMKKIPCDPSNVGQLVYTYAVNGNGYNLIACLENSNDTQKDTTNDSTYCSGSSNWSYTLTNP